MSNVVQLKNDEPEWLIGPFEEYRVLVEGRVIPKLTGMRHSDGTIALSVDRRFCGIFSTERDAQQAAYLIANAMAIFSGYPYVGAMTKDQPFASVACEVTIMETSK